MQLSLLISALLACCAQSALGQLEITCVNPPEGRYLADGVSYSIKTPGFPGQYTNGQSCVWKFVVAAKRDVVLTCSTFQLAGDRSDGNGNCQGDKLTVEDTSDSLADVAFGRKKHEFCDMELVQETIHSASSGPATINLVFSADAAVSANGFQCVIETKKTLVYGQQVIVPASQFVCSAAIGGNLTVKAMNALTNEWLRMPVTINYRDGINVGTLITNSNGTLTAGSLSCGHRIDIDAKATGFYDVLNRSIVINWATQTMVVSLMPKSEPFYQVVLNWKDLPLDLDLYVAMTRTGRSIGPSMTKDVCFVTANATCGAVFHNGDSKWGGNSGSESISITANEFYAKHLVYVVNFSGELPLAGSNAQVQIYGLSRNVTLTVPDGPPTGVWLVGCLGFAYPNGFLQINSFAPTEPMYPITFCS